jgi:hypothetical protein
VHVYKILVLSPDKNIHGSMIYDSTTKFYKGILGSDHQNQCAIDPFPHHRQVEECGLETVPWFLDFSATSNTKTRSQTVKVGGLGMEFFRGSYCLSGVLTPPLREQWWTLPWKLDKGSQGSSERTLRGISRQGRHRRWLSAQYLRVQTSLGTGADFPEKSRSQRNSFGGRAPYSH